MRALLYERLSPPRATSPGARSPRQFYPSSPPSEPFAEERVALRPGHPPKAYDPQLGWVFLYPAAPRYEPRASGDRLLRSMHWRPYLSIFQDLSLHGRLRMRLSVTAWQSAQLQPLASTTDACEGDGKDRPRDSSGLDDWDWDYRACSG
jgi:hypothetical protein